MFVNNMLIAAEQVAILYLIAAVGFIMDKIGWFTESTAKKCTNLLFYVVVPAKLLESFITLEYSKEAVKGLFIAIGMGMLMHAVAALFVSNLYKKCPEKERSVYRFAAMYGNTGFMGLPLIDAVLGSEGVFYCSAVIISFQIFCFTHGVWIMNRDKKENKEKISIKKLIINPGVIPVIIGLPLFIFSVKLPNVIQTPIISIASLNSPFAMLVVGTYFAHTDYKAIFKGVKVLNVSFVKLLLLPAVTIGLIKLFGITGTIASTIAICAATPTANNTIIFSAKYEQDTRLASRTVAVVSLISIFTLPVIIAFSKAVL